MDHKLRSALFQLACAYGEMRSRGFSHAELDGIRLAMRMVKYARRYANQKMSRLSRFPWRTA